VKEDEIEWSGGGSASPGQYVLLVNTDGLTACLCCFLDAGIYVCFQITQGIGNFLD